tara:strand:+ start:108 stop:383 length:276 start_codon:yes stop_codon:yes gene_type:complete
MQIVLCVLISVSLIAAVILIALSRVSVETYQNGSPVDAKEDQKMFMFHNNECKTDCCVSGKGNNYSCSVGCVCVNEEQQNMLTTRGGNHTK